MTENKRFNIYDEYNADMKYYKLPQVFFTSPIYSELSDKAKIAWCILRNRLQISKKNKWIDENGDIYFRFSNKQLANILNCSSRTVSSIRSELKKVNLLATKSRGLTLDDHLYLQYPIVTMDDIYKIDNNETLDPKQDNEFMSNQAAALAKQRHSKDASQEEISYPSIVAGTKKNEDDAEVQKIASQQKADNTAVSTEVQNIASQEVQKLRTSNTYSNKLTLDTVDTIETETESQIALDTNSFKNLESERETLANVFYKNHRDSYFNKISLTKILVLAGYNTSDAERILKASNNAKRKVEKTSGDTLYLSHRHATLPVDVVTSQIAEELLQDAVEQIIYQVKKGTVNDKFAYGYTVFLSTFIEIAFFKLLMDVRVNDKSRNLFNTQVQEMEQLATKHKFDVSKIIEDSTRLANQFETDQVIGQEN